MRNSCTKPEVYQTSAIIPTLCCAGKYNRGELTFFGRKGEHHKWNEASLCWNPSIMVSRISLTEKHNIPTEKKSILHKLVAQKIIIHAEAKGNYKMVKILLQIQVQSRPVGKFFLRGWEEGAIQQRDGPNVRQGCEPLRESGGMPPGDDVKTGSQKQTLKYGYYSIR